MKRMVIKGGRVIDPASKIDGLYNLYVAGGRIASIRPADTDTQPQEGKDLEVIDADGSIVIPGLVDMHTHLREPGYEYKETIRTGTMSAVAGGFTTVVCMANTDPVNDNESVTRYILKKAERAFANVFPVGALSVGLNGERLTEMADLKDAGCVAVSDDGVPVRNGGLMRRALEYSRIFDLPVITHAEDPSISADGVMNEGVVSTRLGLRGIPNAAEDGIVARDIAIAELTGGRLHIAHVSTRGSVELIRSAKRRGVKVTAEVTPHHLVLDHSAVDGYNTNAKMNPPLRAPEDVEALREALRDGTIDCIATDHAPHSSIEKDVEFDLAENGIVGLETAFSIVYGLVEKGVIDLSRAISLMSINPARIIGIDRGTLRVGAPADITIVDLKKRWTVDPARFRSKGRNTPFEGMELRGTVEKTIVGGRVVFEREGTVEKG